MPKPPLGLEAKAQNINERLPLILACSPAHRQVLEARSHFSPQNFQVRSPQIIRWNDSAPFVKFFGGSNSIKQLPQMGGAI